MSSLALSPLNQRRLANFRKNRRGWWSFWLFLVLFVLTSGAEFITNDRPVLVSYKGEFLAPAFVGPFVATASVLSSADAGLLCQVELVDHGADMRIRSLSTMRIRLLGSR